ncbi:hypothetical protein BIU98_16750 [Curtobacterium sp. MMLR14_010]|uniref:hypothetical protein n=1 Tax=Curtobacterium sp. MMLR14_010 TaxID=1898743 RepID=UPI0008DE0AA9|nr:hypothetical protein [Curtobacterium sp. MMLR14_010]OII37102.1 hypothetical protein BIU98_16750 [Curtobacterium sp. MMLR14_010]
MNSVTVVYHREDGAWWAESADAAGWTAAADTFAALQDLVRESLAFHFETEDIKIEEKLDDGAVLTPPTGWFGASVASAFAKISEGFGVAALAPTLGGAPAVARP